MAVALSRLRAAWATACAAALPLALAMGPGAPFVPPTAQALAGQALASAPTSGSVATAPAAPTAAPAADLSAEGLSGLRLAGPRSSALIDGLWWPLGSMPRGARLVAVQRQQVQLRHLDGRIEVLALNPAIEAGRAAKRPPPPNP